MSATANVLQAAQRALRLSPRHIFWSKAALQIVFGCLFLVDSLFFVLSHATFDFFGARNSPFFGWLQHLSGAMQTLYFPVLAAALLSIGLGKSREQGKRAERLSILGVVIQVSAGAILILFQAKAGYYGWALLFGPKLQSLIGRVDPYTQAVVGLIPVVWISAIRVATSYDSARRRSISNAPGLGSFLLAGLTVSLLYAETARMRWTGSEHPFGWASPLFSIAAHLGVITFVFLVLQWIRVAANRFPNPGLAQFSMNALAAWVVMAVLVRKLIFALLSFNDSGANIYAALFSLAVVLFTVGLKLEIREHRASAPEPETASKSRYSWTRPACALVSAGLVYYIFAIKFGSVDWEHILSSVAALITGGLVLYSFLAIRRPARCYGVAFLAVLSVLAVSGLAGLQAIASRQRFAAELEQYSDYDPSFFALHQALKPVVQEGSYSAWYKFLLAHANIRRLPRAPYSPLTDQLTTTPAKKPNIFVFVIDALRRDYISAYNPAVTYTPAFGAFAKESVVFQNAYSPYAGTPLADAAILSGFQQISDMFPDPISHLNNLQPMLKIDGYESYISYNTQVALLARETENVTRLQGSSTSRLEFGAITREIEDHILERKDTRRPIFAFAQPTNVHSLWLAWESGAAPRPHPGFDDQYASGVEQVDQIFGEFVDFLKKQGLYDNSIIVLTADHGESLGEMGRQSHVENLSPEVIQIPLIIHLPTWNRSKLTWDDSRAVSLHDLTPTLYYLLGHRPLNRGAMVGHALFTDTYEEQIRTSPDHYLLMSSYLPVFGVLSSDQKNLFFVNATLKRSYYYDLEHDPHALRNQITAPIRDHYESVLRQDLEAIDKFYGVTEQQLAKSEP